MPGKCHCGCLPLSTTTTTSSGEMIEAITVSPKEMAFHIHCLSYKPHSLPWWIRKRKESSLSPPPPLDLKTNLLLLLWLFPNLSVCPGIKCSSLNPGVGISRGNPEAADSVLDEIGAFIWPDDPPGNGDFITRFYNNALVIFCHQNLKRCHLIPLLSLWYLENSFCLS